MSVVNVICMKWGVKYDASYVNRLRGMVARHLHRLHRFVCFTDDPAGIDARVEIRPLPEMPVALNGPERGWRKLATFRKDLGGLSGTTLFLDLDLLIVDSIDCLFDYPGRFCIIRDWLRRWRRTGNSSVYRFEIGGHTEVLDHFVRNSSRVAEEFRNEQEYLSHQVGELTYWPADWCRSFKRSCIPAFPLNLLKTPLQPPGCKIVVFHGFPHPHEAVRGYNGSLHRRCLPTPWVAQHWRE
jgi:hypothetical protein